MMEVGESKIHGRTAPPAHGRNNNNHNNPRRRRPHSDQRFSSYLGFGYQATGCFCLFCLIYAVLLFGAFYPLLQQESPVSNPLLLRRGEVLQPALHRAEERLQAAISKMKEYHHNRPALYHDAQEQVHHAVEKMKGFGHGLHLPHHHSNSNAHPQAVSESEAVEIKQRIYEFKQTHGLSDASLMSAAAEELNALKRLRGAAGDPNAAVAAAAAAAAVAVVQRSQKQAQPVEDGGGVAAAAAAGGDLFAFNANNNNNANLQPPNLIQNNLHPLEQQQQQQQIAAPSNKRVGFVVLGMHRSGTSMLSGLLVTGLGYKTGGPLIGSAFDNEKGFFERIDVVLQNDEFFHAQQVWWASGVRDFNNTKALEDYKTGKVTFKEGKKALEFLNDPSNAPWLQKDPRMCITLSTWLPLLNNEPAVVFTYRHPLEVTLSLVKREQDFYFEQGLRLWIIYNMRAVQQSAHLCRVLSSNEAILKNPREETQRISDELTRKCGLPPPDHALEQEVVDKFVDPSLQHNKKKRELEDENLPIIDKHNDGTCIVRDFTTPEPPDSDTWKRQRKLYLAAMKIYCDFQSGKAYEPDYAWPSLD